VPIAVIRAAFGHPLNHIDLRVMFGVARTTDSTMAGGRTSEHNFHGDVRGKSRMLRRREFVRDAGLRIAAGSLSRLAARAAEPGAAADVDHGLPPELIELLSVGASRDRIDLTTPVGVSLQCAARALAGAERKCLT